MNKFLGLFLVISLITGLIASSITYQDVYGASYKNQITKSIDKDADGYGKVCEVWQNTTTNKELHKVYEKKNSLKCATSEPEPIPVPVNKKPILQVDSPIKCVVDTECTMTIEEVKDLDGNITAILWNQVSGSNVNLTVGNLSATFPVIENGTFKFTVEAQDNSNASTVKTITVNVGAVVPVPPVCEENEHLENGVCVPDVVVPPASNTTNIILVGDFGGTAVTSQAQKADPELFVALGDLFYGSDLSKYSNLVFKEKACVIGNHDTEEDGSGAIISQVLSQCKQLWTKTLPHTIVVGWNSNGDQDALLAQAKQIDFSSYDNVVLASHKPCATSPDSNHPVSEDPQVKKFCDGLKPLLVGKNVITVSGHNHQMAGTLDGKTFVSGAGGRSHYVCQTDSTWTYCNNQKYGYLELLVDNNTGNLDARFVDTNGQVLKTWG